jgi:hypothetical protein
MNPFLQAFRLCSAVVFCSGSLGAAALLQLESSPVLRPYGRQEMKAQLDGLHFESVEFNQTPLQAAIKTLTAEAQNSDYRHNALNLLAEDTSAVQVTIAPPLKNVSLRDVLDAITRGASKPLGYRIEPHGVVFVRHDPVMPGLYTRWFKLKWEVLQEKFPELRQADGQRQVEVFRRFLAAHGLNLSAPREMFLNARLGQLLVRATLDELDQIEALLKDFQTVAQPIEFHLYFAEVPAPATPSLQPNLSWDAALAAEAATKQFKPSTSALNGVFSYEQSRTGGFATNRSRATNFAAVTGTLSEAQFEAVVKTLQQKTGVDLLKFPKKIGRDTQPALFQMNSPATGQPETRRHIHDILGPVWAIHDRHCKPRRRQTIASPGGHQRC